MRLNTMNETGNMEDISAETVPSSFVYMLYSQGLIKIGFTTDHIRRFDSLRSMSAVPMSVVWLAHGTRRIEQMLHRGFANDRVRGEWFRLSPSIRNFLQSRSNDSRWSPIRRLEWSRPIQTASSCLGLARSIK